MIAIFYEILWMMIVFLLYDVHMRGSRVRCEPREITADQRQKLLREGRRAFVEPGVVNCTDSVFTRLIGDQVRGLVTRFSRRCSRGSEFASLLLGFVPT
jgi:hypothetical protein